MNRSSNRKAGQVKGAVIGSAASLLIAVSSPSILAQEVEAAVDSQQNQGEEIVEVRGVRFALEDALNIKRRRYASGCGCRYCKPQVSKSIVQKRW